MIREFSNPVPEFSQKTDKLSYQKRGSQKTYLYVRKLTCTVCLPVTCLYKALNVCYNVLCKIIPAAKQNITVFENVKPSMFLEWKGQVKNMFKTFDL